MTNITTKMLAYVSKFFFESFFIMLKYFLTEIPHTRFIYLRKENLRK